MMKKIPCLFERDFSDRKRPALLTSVTPGCEWVLAGEGVATRKCDGSACLVKEGKLFKRYDCRKGKTPPEGFIPCEPEPDATTGHWPGWLAVDDGPECKWHREAWNGLRASDGTRFHSGLLLDDGTYELCGPKIQGNPERLLEHTMIRHGSELLAFVPRDWEGLKAYLEEHPIEGIVWHHPDGRMAKLRRDDFGFAWPVTA